LTVTATGINKAYDGTTTATVRLADNKVSGDNLTDNYSSAAFLNPNVGANKTLNAIGISINGVDAPNYVLVKTTASTTANIGPPPTAPPPTITSVIPNSGPTNGGTTVTISGTNFQSGATVAFGSLLGISVAFNSSTNLTAVTPAVSAGPINIIITNPDSQAATLTNGFTYANFNLVSSNLVQDGSFESPTVSGSYTYFQQGDSFAGVWVVEQPTAAQGFAIMNASDPYIQSLFSPTPAGNQFGYSGDWVTDLRQDLSTQLSAHESYSLSCRLSGFHGSPSGTITVVIEPTGFTNAAFTGTFTGVTNWAKVQTNFSVSADGFYTLRLSCNGPGIVGLDNVSITALPSIPPVFYSLSMHGNAFALTWSAVPGQNHQLQYKTSLSDTNWVNLGGYITASNGTVSVSDPIGSNRQRFYRVMLIP
jgi:hypothetical protein